jgi:hypothetical protein
LYRNNVRLLDLLPGRGAAPHITATTTILFEKSLKRRNCIRENRRGMTGIKPGKSLFDPLVA